MNKEQIHPLHATDKKIIDSLISKDTPEDYDLINLARLINRYNNFPGENEMKDDIENSEMLMEKIKNIYREHTKIPEKVLEDILKHDLWWEAEKCLQFGLVDEII